MSPRAAWRLESMGFAEVYDYVAGKADWGAPCLPLEVTAAPRVGELARRHVPTCRLDEPLGGAPPVPGPILWPFRSPRQAVRGG